MLNNNNSAQPVNSDDADDYCDPLGSLEDVEVEVARNCANDGKHLSVNSQCIDSVYIEHQNRGQINDNQTN